ncbi:MAG: FAA hydrolase family protein [Bacteroidetes bacterium]|nr:MAG: FAA hydrolase family protein [Bacteroidota bacterium]
MKMICVGRNYREHALELNNPVPAQPLIFFKPDTALLRDNKDFYYPDFTQDLHHECEIVLRIGREGKSIQKDFALDYIDGVGLGIDFTARDIQSVAKEKGHPWTLAKGFDHAAPVSAFVEPSSLPPLHDLRFRCELNGEVKQEGHSADMLFSIPDLLAFISRYITLKKGDLIFTGTPAGVGPVQPGDRVTAYLEGEKMLDFAIR